MSIYGTYLNEAYDNSRYINEFGNILGKLFKKKKKINLNGGVKCYICSYTKYSVGSSFSVYGDLIDTIAEAIRKFLCISFGLRKDSNYTMNKKDNEKMVKDTKTVYLYKGTAKFKASSKGCLEYDFKVDEILCEDTINTIINKYDIKFDIKDTTSVEKSRAKIYNEALKISKQIVKEALNKYPGGKAGFAANGFYDDDEKEEFLSGIEDNFPVVNCDAWEYTGGKARDEEEYKKYTECFNFIYGQCKEKLSKYGKIDYYGDWDDGPIVLIVK